VTTRLQRLDPKFEILPLKVLPPKKALALLGKILGEADSRLIREPEKAKELCQWLGYLPLGLELVGYYLFDDPDLSIAEVLEELKEKGVKAGSIDWEEEALAETGITAQRGVKAAFELSWEKLNAEAQHLGALLAVFANETIPGELLEAVTQELGWSPKALREGKKQLDKLSLVERSEELEGGYQLHPLIWQFLQSKLAQAEEAEAYKKVFVSVLIARAKDIDPDITIQEVANLQFVIPHLQTVAEHYLSLVADEDIYWAFQGVGAYYYGQGLYFLAEPWLENCLQATRGHLGNEHLDVAQSLNNLGLLYRSQGRYEAAEPLYTQALEMRQRLLEEDHPHVAQSLNNLGLLYRSQGRYEAAEPLYTRALALYKRRLGDDHPHVATSLDNLAYLYSVQGRYEEAELLHTQALEMRQRLLEEDHPHVATSLNNLAILYYSQRRYEDAELFYKHALEMTQRRLGEDHPHVATCLNNLAMLYSSQGRYEETEPLYTQALAMRQRLLGDDHPAVANAVNNLATLYFTQGRYPEAELLYTKALEIYDRALGTNHPNTITVRENLEYMRSQK